MLDALDVDAADTVPSPQARKWLDVSLPWWGLQARIGYVPLIRTTPPIPTRVPRAWLEEVTRGIPGPFVSVRTVAEEVGASRSTIKRMIREGEVAAIRLGPRNWMTRVPVSEIDRLFNENIVGQRVRRHRAA